MNLKSLKKKESCNAPVHAEPMNTGMKISKSVQAVSLQTTAILVTQTTNSVLLAMVPLNSYNLKVIESDVLKNVMMVLEL